MQTPRITFWDALRCRCSSLSQQHMAQKFAKVRSYCSWLEYFIFLALCLHVGVEQLWWDEPGPRVTEPAECVHNFHPRPLMAFIPCTNSKKLSIRTSQLVCHWACKSLFLFFFLIPALCRVAMQQCANLFVELIYNFLVCPNQTLAFSMDKGRKSLPSAGSGKDFDPNSLLLWPLSLIPLDILSWK